MTLEELAKWHEKMAAAHKRDFERYGNVAMVSEGVSAFAHHTAAAATIRAAMGEIERVAALEAEIERLKSCQNIENAA